MDPHILAAVFSLFTALSFWVSVPYTPFNPVNPFSTRLLGALQATATSYGVASILGGLLPDYGAFQLPVAHAGSTMEPSITAESFQYPSVTTMTSSMAPPGSRSYHEAFGGSPDQDPGWILYTVFVLARDEFWRSPNLYTVLAAILIPVWMTIKSLSDRPTDRPSKTADRERNRESARIDELSHNFRVLDQRLNGLITTVSALQQKPAQSDGLPAETTGNLKGQFDMLLPGFRSLQSDLKNLTTTTSVLQHRTDPMDARISSLSDEVGALRTEVAAASPDNAAPQISTVKTDLHSLQASTAAKDQQLELDLASAIGRVAALEESESATAAAPSPSNVEQARLRQKVGVLESDISSLGVDLDNVKGSSSANESSINDLVARVDPAIAVVNAKPWEKKTKSLTKILESLNAEIEGMKGFDAAEHQELVPKVDDLSDKQGQLPNELKSTAAAIKKNLDSELQSIKDTYVTRIAHQFLQDTVSAMHTDLQKQKGSSGEQTVTNTTASRLNNLDKTVRDIQENYVTKRDHRALSDAVSAMQKKPQSPSSVGQNTNDNASRLDALDQEINGIKEHYVTKTDHQALSSAVDGVTKDQKELSGWKDEASEETKSLANKVRKSLNDQVDAESQSKKLSTMTDAVRQLQTGSASAAEIMAVHDKIDRLPVLSESRIKALRGEYEGEAQSMKEMTDHLSQEVQVVNDKVKTVDTEFHTFKQGLKEMGVDEIFAQLTGLKKSVASCERNLETVENSMTTLQSVPASTGGNGPGTDELSELKDKLSSYATSLEEVKQKTSELKSCSCADSLSTAAELPELTELKDKLSTYAVSLEEIKKKVSELESTPAPGDAGLSTAEFEDLKNKVSTYATSLEDVKKKVSELESTPAPDDAGLSVAEFEDLKSKLSTYASGLDEVKKTVSDLQPTSASGDGSLSAAEVTDIKDKLSTYTTNLDEVKAKVSELESAASAVNKEEIKKIVEKHNDFKDRLNKAENQGLSNEFATDNMKFSTIPNIQQKLNMVRWASSYHSKEAQTLAEKLGIKLPAWEMAPDEYGRDLYYPWKPVPDSALSPSQRRPPQKKAEEPEIPVRDSELFESKWAPTGAEKEKVIQKAEEYAKRREEEKKRKQEEEEEEEQQRQQQRQEQQQQQPQQKDARGGGGAGRGAGNRGGKKGQK